MLLPIADPLTQLEALWREEVPRLLDEAGLPPAMEPLALATLELRLAAIRHAVARWHPRPAFQPDEDLGGFYDELAAVVEREAHGVVADLTIQRDKLSERIRSGFQEWNHTRDVASDRAHPSVLRLFATPDPKEPDQAERVNHPDGTFSLYYPAPRQNAEDEATARRIAKERAARRSAQLAKEQEQEAVHDH